MAISSVTVIANSLLLYRFDADTGTGKVTRG
jgi:hypothetical protein